RTPPAPPDWRRRNSPRRSRPWPRWRPSTSRPSGRSRTGGRGSRGSRGRSRRSRPRSRPPRRRSAGSTRNAETGGPASAAATAESALAEVEAEHLKAVRAIADRREGVARLAGKVETLAARIESTEAEIGRIDQERENARSAVADAEAEFDSVYARVGAHSEGERTLDDHLGRAERAHLDARARLTELRETERNADQEIARLTARIETLEQNKGAGDGAEWLVGHLGEETVAGTVGEVLGVEDGWERAIGVALGPAVDAVVVDSDVDRRAVL